MKTSGVDIGGTKIRWLIRNGNNVIARERPVPAGKSAFASLMKGINRELEAAGVRRAGIGVAGAVRGTTLLSAANLPRLKRVDFARFFPTIRIRLNNDARCFARAEMILKGTALYLALGTGVGRAVSRNGKLAAIKRFEYAERWEKEYQQKVRGADATAFLLERIGGLIRAIRPDTLVLGGGALRKKGLYAALKSGLERKLAVKVRRSHRRQNAVAWGATMLAG